MVDTICPHCGFENEDDEMCRACGELFEDIPARSFTARPPSTTTCPHCGQETEDDEYCRVCGELFEDDAPVRHVTFGQVIAGLFSWLKDGFTPNSHADYVNGRYISGGNPGSAPSYLDEEIDGMFEDNDIVNCVLEIDPMTDPVYSHMSGNIYHIDDNE